MREWFVTPIIFVPQLGISFHSSQDSELWNVDDYLFLLLACIPSSSIMKAKCHKVPFEVGTSYISQGPLKNQNQQNKYIVMSLPDVVLTYSPGAELRPLSGTSECPAGWVTLPCCCASWSRCGWLSGNRSCPAILLFTKLQDKYV